MVENLAGRESPAQEAGRRTQAAPEVRPVETRRDGPVALLRLAAPAGNALSAGMRRALAGAVRAAEADPSVGAIVLAGEGGAFCTGFPEEEPVSAEADRELLALCDLIESCETPVIAALQGPTLGAGLALALAAHERVMGRSARLGAPEIGLGLVPGGGLTQRLPRLAGAEVALDLLLSGRSVAGVEAARIGLADALAQRPPVEEAIVRARERAAAAQPPRRSREETRGLRDGAGVLRAVAMRRAAEKGRQGPAAGLILDCVEAALMLPFEAGLAREAVAREDAAASPQAQALRHVALAERRAVRLPAGVSVAARAVETLGIVGTGSVALTLAQAALDHGMGVVLVASSADRLVVAERHLVTAYDRAVAQGQLAPEARDARLARFRASPQVDALRASGLVIEAAQSPVGERARVLARVEEFLPEETVLATVANRGFGALARDLAHPERFLGLHPAGADPASPVLELARPEGLSDAALAMAHAVVQRLGRLSVTLRARDGLIAERVQGAGWAAVDLLLLMGARPARIDAAMRGHGFAVGPCALMDAMGLDRLDTAVAELFAAEGRTGRAAGIGFYRYDGTEAVSDSEAVEVLDALRAQGRLAAQEIADREIVERIVLAQANAGARLVQSGTVARPLDIDVVMTRAMGFPRWRGGPMKAADLMGLFAAERRLSAFAPAAPDIWTPATIWHELVKNGENFDDLNAL
ncbi:enoyl-CoA hydratase-related protein [Celeribacter indicus]|uniref:3-hydroxyacyl-CoA dehydrogenase n=1 Tax=Celeribacter indicus TaxID=1208324 RepID=A0A0B5DXK8_9RHOB|nr:enoyl-CoA hydratase-related protein [Celeribacter indicus]AJE47724.1 3-hydroxyacyl-CoA dehydrogenase [Celeribacter indicus]SDW15273.1 3-hydroxyacyl-CoA dehydrogenase [Celeribacter indicus]